MADSFNPDDIPDDIVIQVDDLSKHYGELKAVDSISFGVGRGEVFGILGPNGAGKTTTLECIEGLVEPTSGKTSVLGIDTQREPQKVKERIGVQLQASAYFDFLTLKEILDLFGMFYNRRVAPIELLEQVNLADRANTTVAKLSGGQQQRFTIAATLVNDPEVVFLDEPTTGLDPQARRSLWEFVQAINSAGAHRRTDHTLHGRGGVSLRPHCHHGQGQDCRAGHAHQSGSLPTRSLPSQSRR